MPGIVLHSTWSTDLMNLQPGPTQSNSRILLYIGLVLTTLPHTAHTLPVSLTQVNTVQS
jgi:hypothetical protein